MSDKDHYLTDRPELCNKFPAAHALILESPRNAYWVGGGAKPHVIYGNYGIMSLDLL